MEQFLKFIQAYTILLPDDIELLKKHLRIESVNAKSYILKQGRVCNNLSFIAEGIVRIFNIDENGTEITKHFYNENHFILDSVSYQKRSASIKNIQAVTNCKILIISRESDILLADQISKWHSLKNTISVEAFSEKYNNTSELLHSDAQTRYINFLKEYPDIVQRVPLGQLASYLGIAQQSLSRIRKQIVS